MEKEFEVTPNYLGKNCAGNGETGGERLCDDCVYLDVCFPVHVDEKYSFGDRRDYWAPIVRKETCLECKHGSDIKQNKQKTITRLYCGVTKRFGRELRGVRCPHFEKKDLPEYIMSNKKVENLSSYSLKELKNFEKELILKIKDLSVQELFDAARVIYGHPPKIKDCNSISGSHATPAHQSLSKLHDVLNPYKPSKLKLSVESRVLFQAIFLYLYYECNIEDQTLANVKKLLDCLKKDDYEEQFDSVLDIMFMNLKDKDCEHFAVKCYGYFKLSSFSKQVAAREECLKVLQHKKAECKADTASFMQFFNSVM